MKKISVEEMAKIQGGGLLNFINGFCAGASLVGLASTLGLLTITGVGIPVAWVIGIGCAGSTIYQGLNQ